MFYKFKDIVYYIILLYEYNVLYMLVSYYSMKVVLKTSYFEKFKMDVFLKIRIRFEYNHSVT